MSKSVETSVAVLESRVNGHDKELAKKVDKAEFLPIRLLVYGATGLILIGVVATLLRLAHIEVPTGG